MIFALVFSSISVTKYYRFNYSENYKYTHHTQHIYIYILKGGYGENRPVELGPKELGSGHTLLHAA